MCFEVTNLKWTGRSVNTVVTRVGHRCKAQLLPLGKHLAAQRISWGVSRVGRAQKVVTKVFPRHLGRIKLHRIVLDRLPRRRELATHGHVERVERKQGRLAWELQQTAVKAATKFDLRRQQRVPIEYPENIKERRRIT